MTKRCRTCGLEKMLEEFYLHARARDGHGYHCKDCSHALKREYIKANPERRRAWAVRAYEKRKAEGKPLNENRHWRARNPERAWGHNLAKYGITPDEYRALLARQGGGCAICGKTSHANGKLLFVDHDHDANRVRGILCHECNSALGLMGDDPERMEAAVRYLRSMAMRTATTNA